MVPEGPGIETLPPDAKVLLIGMSCPVTERLRSRYFCATSWMSAECHRFQALGAVFHIGDGAAGDQRPAIGSRLVGLAVLRVDEIGDFRVARPFEFGCRDALLANLGEHRVDRRLDALQRGVAAAATA